MRYPGKHIRIGIVDNDALVLGALQYVVRTYLPQSEVIWKETDGNRGGVPLLGTRHHTGRAHR